MKTVREIDVEATETSVASGLAWHVRSWGRDLRRRNLSPHTIDRYLRTVGYFDDFLAERGMPSDPVKITREYVEAYLDDLFDTGRSAETVATRFRGLQQFFKYLGDSDDIDDSPMAKMRPPILPEQPVPVVPEVDMARLFKSLAGSGFEERRDLAALRLFEDTGLRLEELTRLCLEDIDFDLDQVVVLGKGRRPRSVPYGDRAAQALERYIKVRESHPRARRRFQSDDEGDPRNGKRPLWLGTRGKFAMTPSGIRQMVWRRTTAVFGPAGRLHPHQLRHTAAHQHAKAGLQETDMMRLFGWKSSAMPKRYGASAAHERAIAAKRRLMDGRDY